MQSSVAVLADVSLRLSRRLFIFVIKKTFIGSKYPKTKQSNFEKNFTDAEFWGIRLGGVGITQNRSLCGGSVVRRFVTARCIDTSLSNYMRESIYPVHDSGKPCNCTLSESVVSDLSDVSAKTATLAIALARVMLTTNSIRLCARL